MLHRHLVALAAAVVVVIPAIATAPSARAGGGCHGPIVLDARTTLVEMKQACFTPVVTRVEPGDTVVFRNTDAMPHTVTGLRGGIGGFAQMATGQQLDYRFDAAGVFPYHCVLHAGMVGAVVVGDGLPTGGSAGIIAPPITTATARSSDAMSPATPRSGDGGGGGVGWVALGLAAVLVAGGAYSARRATRRITDLGGSALPVGEA